MRRRRAGSCDSKSSRHRMNATITSSGESPAASPATQTPGSGPRLLLNPGGSATNAIVWPGLIPSLRGKGIPE